MVLASLGLMIIGLVFFFLQLATFGSPWPELPAAAILVVGAVSVVGVIAVLGMAATFVSLHDRHQELVAEVRKLRLHLTGPDTDE